VSRWLPADEKKRMEDPPAAFSSLGPAIVANSRKSSTIFLFHARLRSEHHIPATKTFAK
jgi:hypothetical protein